MIEPTRTGVSAEPRPVTVIVPAYNEAASLADTLQSLQAQTALPREIIVVDDSTDETVQIIDDKVSELNRLGIDAIVSRRPTRENYKCGALNKAMNYVTGDYVLLLDADSIISRGWLFALIAPLTKEIQASNGKSFPICRTPISQSELMERIDAYEVKNSVILLGNGSIAIRLLRVIAFRQFLRCGRDDSMVEIAELIHDTRLQCFDERLN
jgi:glycosyltransferase involved in cell wall biosynthesis